MHYLAALAIVPLCAWLLTRSRVPRTWRWAYVGCCLLLVLALVPLLIGQHGSSMAA